MPAAFVGDVYAKTAALMADAQVPWGPEALGGTSTTPAWKSKPSWYLLVTDDKMLPLPAQRFISERAGATVDEMAGKSCDLRI
jgi:hypothetical protein